MRQKRFEHRCCSLWVLKYFLYIGFPAGALMMIYGLEKNLYGDFRWYQSFITDYQENFNDKQKSTVQGKLFKILWYTPPPWLVLSRYREIAGCALDNCEVLFDKNELNGSDLVLFHHKYNLIINPPVKRSNQIWVFVSLEAPHYTTKHYMKRKWRDKFDWIMSYRTNAEGYAPYGKIVPVTITKKRNYTAKYLQKQKDVAWVVSHCHTQSKREKYVEQMKNFINVDIFGKCGKPCVSDCFQTIMMQYKFYLSFENSVCEDYVTEKLYKMFNTEFDIIPVVRGAPNVKDLVPENTFISTLDFQTPELLAKHLKIIGSDEKKYTDMLKTKHKFTNTLHPYTLGLCSLCKKLNNNFIRGQKMKLDKVLSPYQCKQPNDV